MPAEPSLHSSSVLPIDEDCILCHLTDIDALDDSNDEDKESNELVCHHDHDLGFRDTLAVTLPGSVLEEYEALIQSGAAHLCIPRRFRVGNSIVVPEGTNVKPYQRRKLLSHKDYTIGTKRVLAVRITSASGEEPDESVEDIQAAIFGSGDDTSFTSVVHQYEAVSHGQLQLIPAQGSGIENGVIQVQLPDSFAGKEIQSDLTSNILAMTREAVGLPLDEVAEHFIFCLPSNSLLNGKSTWTAFTYLFEPYSYYQQSRCTKLSVVMHEVGHSLGFRHSGYAGNEYADESGYMGYAVNEISYPRKSFNAHKHWISNWFIDRAVEVNPDRGAVIGHLASFVDYRDPDLQQSDVVLMRAGNLYLHYNRAKGYNSDTPSAYKDRVVVTESPGALEVSNFVAALSKGQSYFYPNFSGYNSLVIEVCDQMTGAYDYAVVSMYIQDGIQKSICEEKNLDANAQPQTYPLNTTDTDIANVKGTPINEDLETSERSRVDPVIGIVWGAVAVLFLVAIYLIYRIRCQQKGRVSAHAERKKQRRRSWIPSTIETVSRSSKEAGDSESDVSYRTTTCDLEASMPHDESIEVEAGSSESRI